MMLSSVHADEDMSRRTFLEAGVGAAAAGLLTTLFPGKATAQDVRKKLGVIFVWLDGGMSQVDSFDHKPASPMEIRGDPSRKWPTGIQTRTRDAIFSSWFSGMAERSDKFALLRSMRADSSGTHASAYDQALRDRTKGHLMLRMAEGSRIVPYSLMDSLKDTNFNPERECFEPARSLPFEWEPKGKTYVMRADITRPANHDERTTLLRGLDRHPPAGAAVATWNEHVRLANRLLNDAVDQAEDDPRQAERYGRNKIGMGILAARNAVAAGLSTVAVVRTGPWDIHYNIPDDMETKSRQLDRAVSALLDDMGREWDGLFVMRGEFGRTPVINASAGRDHHPLHTGIIAHANIVPGAYGETCRDCKRVTKDEVRNDAFAATILELATGKTDVQSPAIARLFKRRFAA